MESITVSVEVAAPPGFVWDHLSDLSSHTEWMSDAVSITFETEQRRGVGARMRVPTRVGPLRVIDIMEVDRWTEARTIGVRRLGRIGGWGRFDLSPRPGGSRLDLTESLRFPWYMGGPLTARLARPVLRRIFAANLRRFRDWVQALYGPEG